MRHIECDVCGDDFKPDDDLIDMVIPASFLNEAEDDGIRIDVCSWKCIAAISEAMLTGETEGEEVQEEEKPQAFIAVPKTPTIDTNMDEKTLARFTEQVTGVKRR